MYKGHNLTMGGGLAREGSLGKDLEAKLGPMRCTQGQSKELSRPRHGLKGHGQVAIKIN